MTTLHERAMLATLRLSAYSGMMADKEVTAAAHAQYQAEADAGKYGKRLIASRFLSDVNAAHNNARRIHKMLTLPWADDGTRILTSAGFMQYQQRMKGCKNDVEEAVHGFVSGLNNYIEEAKHRLKGMFNEADYPTQEELKSKFGFDIEFSSLPQPNDFRVRLSDAQVKSITKDIQSRCDARYKAAINDVYNRVIDKVGSLSTKLKEYVPSDGNGNKAQNNIRESTLYGIYDFAKDMLPILNITGDVRMDRLRVELMDGLMEHSPEILRSDPKARKETISKADAILKKVKEYVA